ncbi:hypothetical protein Forpe1208_v014388 [Fusarium oxysporum f. sp. rapae]|uniref:Uncharacterized protein n=1 Tax=Fusarium oxysporum f. sp. rapae TaxID=485398 RepID=A0A8J5U067_FUSOX|nr:hypothetical protein Forpe1208_v014388 [Fusarium oxysporum f. sp. rapae]
MGETLQYELGPPASSADFGAVMSQLNRLGAAEKYEKRDEAVAIENITDFMSHHPAALQVVTGLMRARRLVEWEQEFRPPSLKLFLSWLESWGLIDLSATTDAGYIYFNPLMWYTLQYLFAEAFADVTMALVRFIGYASFVKITMTRLSIGKLDTLGQVPVNKLEKASDIASIAIALTHLTPTDATHELLIEALASDSSIASTMRLVRTLKVMLGPHVIPLHYSYFSAIFALASLSSRFGETSDLAQLEAIEGLCTLLAQNDQVSFTSWLYFDFSFRFLSNATHLIKGGRGFTREWNPGPLNADLVKLQSELFAPIPRGSEYYTPYHTTRLTTSIKTLIGAHISRCPLIIINKLRSDIVRSCDILLDDNTTPGGLRRHARKIRKFFANGFASIPDMMQVYSLAPLVGSSFATLAQQI